MEAPGQFIACNDTEIYFEVHGSGPPLLLLHGFSGTSQDWAPVVSAWQSDFQMIVPDLRGHGRSRILSKHFRHEEAADDVLAVLDHLQVGEVRGLGVSAGGNILLHLATRQPERVKSMVLVSATPYFPAQGRTFMRQYAASLPEAQLAYLRGHHAGGEAQVQALMESTTAFADSYDDMSFTPPHLSTIRARTLIVQGDRDAMYPLELSVEMYRAIPESQLWIVPNGDHGPVTGERWPEFEKTAAAFLRQ